MKISWNQPATRVLHVAYPMLPVNESTCGGAEQVLSTLERHAQRAGMRTTVAACAGSEAAGAVYSTGARGRGRLPAADELLKAHCEKVVELIGVRSAIGCGFHLVHDHSGAFFPRAAEVEAPVLATLHLPRSFYPPQWFVQPPENVFFKCVSRAQLRSFNGVPRMMGAVPNGIELSRFPFQARKKDYLLWMGRICEEKGPHIALDAAEKAGIPIVLAGKVYPFAYHQDYFEREIAPRLARRAGQAQFIESPSFSKKVALLRHARAVLLSSQVEETSSLVAMEAAACGTPVIAFRRGALPEVAGHVGLLVDWAANNEAGMAAAVADVSRIRPKDCHEYARAHFSAERMFAGYQKLYAKVMKQAAPARIEVPLAELLPQAA